LDVRRMQRRLALDDAALDVLARVRPRVALDHVHALDDEPVLVGEDFQHATALPPVLAGRHEHVVVLANRRGQAGHRQTTSGASEMIFMNLRSRSSRATGPNTRVPMGSFWSLIRTAALRSKRI